jgi:hypothetical protein
MSSDKPSRITPFNPLDKTNLGESVADALLLQPVGPLPPEEPFIGAGDTANMSSVHERAQLGAALHGSPSGERAASNICSCIGWFQGRDSRSLRPAHVVRYTGGKYWRLTTGCSGRLGPVGVGLLARRRRKR